MGGPSSNLLLQEVQRPVESARAGGREQLPQEGEPQRLGKVLHKFIWAQLQAGWRMLQLLPNTLQEPNLVRCLLGRYCTRCWMPHDHFLNGKCLYKYVFRHAVSALLTGVIGRALW